MKVFISLLVVAILSSCAATSTSKQHLPENLIGVWELRFDGSYPYWFSQIGFTADGRKCVLSYEFNASGKVDMTYYANRYNIKDGHLITYVGYSSTPYVRAGEIIKDRIDVLEQDYFEVFMIKPLLGSSAEQHQRLVGVSPEEICKVVDNYRRANQAHLN